MGGGSREPSSWVELAPGLVAALDEAIKTDKKKGLETGTYRFDGIADLGWALRTEPLEEGSSGLVHAGDRCDGPWRFLTHPPLRLDIKHGTQTVPLKEDQAPLWATPLQDCLGLVFGWI